MTWANGATFKVWMALGSADSTSLYGTAVYGTDTYGGKVPDWTNVTEWVQSIDIRRGAERFDDLMKTGLCRVVFDNDGGRFNPDNGTESLPGALSLRPGRWVKVTAHANGSDFELFVGYIDMLDEWYSKGGDDTEMRVTAYDFSGVLAYVNLPAVSAVGSGETTSARITRVLDSANWNSGADWRDLETGSYTMQSTTLADNHLAHCQEAARAESGVFFFEGMKATFKNSNWPSATTPSLYVGTGPFELSDLGLSSWTDSTGRTWTASGDVTIKGAVLGEVLPQVVKADAEWSARAIRNDIQVSEAGGTAQRVTDGTSISTYGRRSWQFFDYQNDTPADVLAIANKLLTAYKDDSQRLTSVTIDAADAEIAEDVFGVTLGDLLSVSVDLSGLGLDYVTDAHVMGIEWEITDSDWSVTYRVDEAFA